MRLLAAVAFAYLLILLIFRVFEHRLIFFPDYPNRLGGDWQPEGLPVEEVWLRATDGIKLDCWWIAGEGAEFTFVGFHGNASNMAARADLSRFLRSRAATVLAAECLCYGH